MQYVHPEQTSERQHKCRHGTKEFLRRLRNDINFRMGSANRCRIALVTSGLGTSCGGIGVVSDMIARSLQRDNDLQIWRHPFSLSRPIRIAILAARATWGMLARPEFVFYDHVHLAVIHELIPGLRGIPYGVFLHGIEVWQPLVERRREALVNAHVLVANSATTVEAVRAVNPWLPQVKVTWLGVPPRARVNVGSLPPQAVIVGRLASAERLKGHDVVLDAWPEICRTIPGVKLVIIGTGDDQPRLRRRVYDERLPNIEFRGRLSDSDRDTVLRSSRILFYPSRQEGFGLAAIEASAYGIPVLGLAGTVMSELFPNGTGAVLVNDTHTSSIVEAAVPVLTDAHYANAIGQAAWERVHSTFLEQHFMDRFRRALAPFVSYVGPEEQLAPDSRLKRAVT